MSLILPQATRWRLLCPARYGQLVASKSRRVRVGNRLRRQDDRSSAALAWRLTGEQLREEMVTAGKLSDRDVSTVVVRIQ
jgi:hypothetical protein